MSAHKTIPIYIGKLCQTTDEDTLLAHLQDIGINLGDISEIKKLTPSGSKKVSYCVSLNSETVANLVKLMDNWPKGIVIRPFSPRHGNGKSDRSTRV